MNFMEPTVMAAKCDLIEAGEGCVIPLLAVQPKINMPVIYFQTLKHSPL